MLLEIAMVTSNESWEVGEAPKRILTMMKSISVALAVFICTVQLGGAADDTGLARQGVQGPGIQRPIGNVHPQAVFPVEGAPDWLVVTEDGVWVASEPLNHVVHLDARTNHVREIITVSKPCSGLAAGFGAIWIPSCGDHTLKRVDPRSARIIASVSVGPADSEGAITTGAGSVWMLTDPKGTLSRIDPASNRVVAEIPVPDGSFACVFDGGAVWTSSTKNGLLTRVDPAANRITAKVRVGPQPRFLTAGGGSIWTLNQGDGSISRVDMKSARLMATIKARIPGSGGEIAYGEGAVWATMVDFPITKIDPQSNRVVKQWIGPGGDSIRVGLGSVWLSNLKQQVVWRIDAGQL